MERERKRRGEKEKKVRKEKKKRKEEGKEGTQLMLSWQKHGYFLLVKKSKGMNRDFCLFALIAPLTDLNIAAKLLL